MTSLSSSSMKVMPTSLSLNPSPEMGEGRVNKSLRNFHVTAVRH